MIRNRFQLNQHGFTLVELSIVLVIVGLIIAGISMGSSLVHSAQLQSVITEQSNFIAAINSFRSKYSQLPGDMNNANAI